MKKRKLTPQQVKLKEEFERMMKKHSKPLERGAKAKGIKSNAQPLSKQSAKAIESDRNIGGKSLDTGFASTAAKRKNEYTGTAIIGISQMHKSNLVPVFNDEAVKDISKMRRG